MAQEWVTTRLGVKAGRGVALLAVLIVVTIGALVGTSLLYAADAGRESASASLRVERSRLLAWSGVQAVMAELASQRDGLIAGETPRVTGAWVFGAEGGGGGGGAGGMGGGVRGAYRLRVVGESELVSEAGKLDVNHASKEMLAKLPGVGEALAEKIVAARGTRLMASVNELLGVEGMTEAVLFGEADEESEGPVDGEVMGAKAGGLAAYLTVFSFDPNVQTGLGEGGADAAGERRLNLNVAWSDELGAAVERRLGEGAAGALKAIMSGGTEFKRDADIVKQLRTLGVEAEEWPPILDVFTTSDGEYLLGRVDLLTAPVEVLACVPGIDEEAAGRIVARRDKVEGELRSSIAWPVVDGILTGEQFEMAVDHLTVRATQWRVVVEAGTVVERPGEETGGDSGAQIGDLSGGGSSGELPDGAELADRVVLEAVIDVSSRRPRVAYLRDVTMLELAEVVRQRVRADVADEARDRERPEDAAMSLVDEAPAAAPVEPEVGGRGPRLTLREPEVAEDMLETPGPLAPEAESEAAPGPAAGPTDGRIGRWTTRSGGGR